MSRFKNEERVQIIAVGSAYSLGYGTVVETRPSSVRVRVDGGPQDAMTFWDTELIPAPNVPAPAKEFLRTQKYIRELVEDTKLLRDAAGLLPQGTSAQKDLQAYASHQAKIVASLKAVLRQDGVTFAEDADGGK